MNRVPKAKDEKGYEVWEHYNGAKYKVLLIANGESIKENYPPTVVYQGLANGKIWSRPLSDWNRSFTIKEIVDYDLPTR